MSCLTCAVVGGSGEGKTTSLRNLNPQETFIISTTGKPLPFRGFKKNYIPLHKNKEGKWEGNYFVSSDATQIIKVYEIINKTMPHIKNVVTDDWQFVLLFEMLDRSGETGFAKFNELAQHGLDLLRYSDRMRDDVIMIFLTHSEDEGDPLNPKRVVKTVGKILKEKVTVEGLFTYVFFTKVFQDEDGKTQYKFITNNDGTCTAKTPMGMFDELEVDNDLNKILEVIREFNEG